MKRLKSLIDEPGLFATTAELDQWDKWLKEMDQDDLGVEWAQESVNYLRQFAPENDRMWAEAEARKAKAANRQHPSDEAAPSNEASIGEPSMDISQILPPGHPWVQRIKTLLEEQAKIGPTIKPPGPVFRR